MRVARYMSNATHAYSWSNGMCTQSNLYDVAIIDVDDPDGDKLSFEIESILAMPHGLNEIAVNVGLSLSAIFRRVPRVFVSGLTTLPQNLKNFHWIGEN